jgi:hypothetical protein
MARGIEGKAMTVTVQIPDNHPCELISQEDRQLV